MQLVRDFAQAECDLFRPAPQVGDLSMGQRQLVRRHEFQAVQSDGQKRDLRSNAVMEFARDPAALLFLRADEPSGQVTDALVVAMEFFLAFQKAGFRLLALAEENGDKHDRQSQNSEEQLQKVHVVRNQRKKWSLMPRDAEYQEDRGEKK